LLRIDKRDSDEDCSYLSREDFAAMTRMYNVPFLPLPLVEDIEASTKKLLPILEARVRKSLPITYERPPKRKRRGS
jgi:hypothetical protein